MGGKVHTARSRNDQVALDTHLYVRRQVDKVLDLIAALQRELIQQAEKHLDVIMPGYTHLQHAQPVLLAHHLLAYVHMLQRDRQRFLDCRERADLMPLGAGGPWPEPGFPLIGSWWLRNWGVLGLVRKQLRCCERSGLYPGVLSGGGYLYGASVPLSRRTYLVVQPGVFFCGAGRGLQHRLQHYAPQKKNPDVPELVRGKAGRVAGHLLALLMTVKGLPLAYNKDLQEDKEALFDTVDTLTACLSIFAPLNRHPQGEPGPYAPSYKR